MNRLVVFTETEWSDFRNEIANRIAEKIVARKQPLKKLHDGVLIVLHAFNAAENNGGRDDSGVGVRG